ncbi:DUF6731 family protein [Comamonas sp. NLF-1-9]|uniref:DUF6731 family protein n=1 Tax=Comamonas sp. NLF-1-9 TaxID=2853163 RepID=UPI001C485E9B|nr:DUF6731 family protein [Comamonas sp. NLF-1-9]QXL84119.1 hypothetical protein KUD94_12895 [Comamonas sp. NLF-1-9]
MARTVTINLFDVTRGTKTQALAQTLQEYAALSIEQRLRDDVRLDQVQQIKADAVLKHEAFHLDFAKARPTGPGRMPPSRPVADVGLEHDELFGEETAALYLPHKNWLLTLHNQYGVGPARMASYFNALDPGSAERHFDYEIRPRIDQHALQRMKSMNGFSHVDVIASVGAFEDLTDDVSESVWQAAESVRAMRVQLRLSANPAHQRGRKLNMRAVREFIQGLLSRDDGVDKIELKSADEQLDQNDRLIDLIEQKIRLRYPATQLDVLNLRYTHDSKIALLRRACSHWLQRLE